MLNLILLVLGCIMDMAPIILIATPILLPIATSIGLDPIQFGIMVVLNCGIGLLTPPVGAVLFIGSAVAKLPMEKVVKATLPFYLCMILALLLNYTTVPWLKKLTQSSTFAPHLISVVVMCGMLNTFSSSTGLFNILLKQFGLEPISFLGIPGLYQTMYVMSGVWQRTGYNAVIYIAALSSVSEDLHEAAIVDGASKLKRVWYIDIPSILPTMVILIIMAVGNLMSIGFEKSLLLQNDLNLARSEIISTYVYKVGIQGAQYSLSTAVSLFNNIINFILLISVNKASKALSGSSLW